MLVAHLIQLCPTKTYMGKTQLTVSLQFKYSNNEYVREKVSTKQCMNWILNLGPLYDIVSAETDIFNYVEELLGKYQLFFFI